MLMSLKPLSLTSLIPLLVSIGIAKADSPVSIVDTGNSVYLSQSQSFANGNSFTQVRRFTYAQYSAFLQQQQARQAYYQRQENLALADLRRRQIVAAKRRHRREAIQEVKRDMNK